MNFPLPANEAERLEALRGYGILDSRPEQSFDDLALLAAHICKTPVALISLVDEKRQWFKSRVGLELEETPRDEAFCAYTIMDLSKVLEVRDAALDPRFADYPFVTAEPGIRFYAGAPLVMEGGEALGSLCVMDYQPRELSAEQLQALQALSRQVASLLELRRHARELAKEAGARRSAEEALQKQVEQLASGNAEAERMLAVSQHSRRALLSVLEDEKLASKHLRESETRVREQAEMLNHASEAIIAKDFHTNRVTFWNKGAERLYGWTAAEALGRDMRAKVYVDLTESLNVEEQLLKSGECQGEFRHVSKAGKELVVRCHFTLVRDAHGRPRSVLIINIDVTEQKRLEAQFLRAQRMESIGTLASGVAHDLNNILAPILMAAPMIREGVDPEVRDRLLMFIETNARRGADIVKQVLTFARGAEGQRVLVQVVHLIKEVAAMAQETFPKGITISAKYPEVVWPVEGDPTQLHQVLLNLCVNARDAMPAGGMLIISVDNFTVDEQFTYMMPEAKPGQYVMVSVSDTGMGIPPAVMEKIFDPFFTTKAPGKGTGLGLSTLAGIVKGHGGFVTVDSELQRGTTFKVFLPSTATTVGVPSDVDRTKVARGNGELILVVDDEESVLNVIQTKLEMHGYRVIAAVDGTEALAVFAKRMPEIDLVLTDMAMPFIDGSALSKVLKKMSPSTPIVGSTGEAVDAAFETELRDAGVKILLRKPYTAGELLGAMRTVLDEAGPRAKAPEEKPVHVNGDG